MRYIVIEESLSVFWQISLMAQCGSLAQGIHICHDVSYMHRINVFLQTYVNVQFKNEEIIQLTNDKSLYANICLLREVSVPEVQFSIEC